MDAKEAQKIFGFCEIPREINADTKWTQYLHRNF